MKTSVKRLFALASASALLLSACGGPGGSGSISDLVTYELNTREVESFNALYTQRAVDLYVITNLQDGLLSNDPNGNLVSGLAQRWETTDEGHTWTFHLREGLKWADVNGGERADLTSADFVTGLEWVLNAAKNEGSSNFSMPVDMIEGAADYYHYTSGLDKEKALALAPDNETFLDMVGIETPDEYTVTYTCIGQKPYFATLATYNCLYPASAALIDELGVDGFRACQPDTMWYSGPYLLTTYVYTNEKIFEPNPLWWGGEENTRFDSVTVKMVDSVDTALQLYQTGELDNVSLSESSVNTIYNAESDRYHDYLVEIPHTKYSYQLQFNYLKKLEDGTEDVNWNTAVRNENFRLAWYYGLELTNYYKRVNAINPLKCENNFFTMTDLVYTSDGRDYTELVREELGLGEYNGETMVRYNEALAREYKQKAMEELAAQGVTFPVEVSYYVAGSNQTEQDSARVLKDCFSQFLGDDFVTLNIKEYVTSQTTEVVTPRLQSFVIAGWSADYGDPQNYLVQEIYGYDKAYYSVNYSNINDVSPEDAPELIAAYQEYTDLVEDADAITGDLDARYAAYAKAEACFLRHALTIPLYYNIGWELTRVNDYSKINAAYGIQSYRYVNWETKAEGYTTEEYAAFAAK